MTLSFTVPWRVTSNNVAARRVGRAMIANPKATRDKQRIWQIAFAAAQEQGWKMPEAAALHIVAINTRKDVGNIEKVISDALTGVAWTDDRILTELRIEKRRDLGDERYEVTVEAREPIAKPKPLRKMRYSDLTTHQRNLLRFGTITPKTVFGGPVGVRNLHISDVPESWYKRACKEIGA